MSIQKAASKAGDFIKKLGAGLLDAYASANLASSGATFASGGFTALAEALGISTTALSTFLSVAAGVGAIVGTVAIIDALTVSGKEAAKAADEAAQAHQEAVAKVEPLKQKLQEVNDKIKEIQSKDKITLTDQEDLARLKEQRDVLKEDIELAERMADIRSRESVKAAKDAISHGGSDALDWRHQTDNDLSIFGLSDEDRRGAGWKYDPRPGSHHRWDYDKISETAALANAYSRYEAEQKRLQNEYGHKHNTNKWSEKDEKANLARQSEVEGYLDKIGPALTANQEALQQYRAEFVNTNNVAREGCEDLVFRIDQVNNAIKGVTPDPFVDLERHMGEVVRLGKAAEASNNWDSAELQHYLGVLSGVDFSSIEDGDEKAKKLKETWQQLTSTIDGSSGKLTLANLFQGNEQKNLEQFWQTVEEVKSEWGEFNEETGELDFNIPSVKELADALGLSEEIVNSIIKKTEQAGANVQVVDRLGNKTMSTKDATKQLKESGVIEKDVKIDLEADNVDEQINAILGGLDKLSKTKDGKIKIDSGDGQAAYTILSQLYEKKNELSRQSEISFKIDTSKITQVADGLESSKVKDFVNQVNEAKQAIQNLNDAEELKTKYNLDIDTTQLETNAKQAVEDVKETLAGIEKDGTKNGLDITGTLTLKQEGLDPKDLEGSLANLKSLSQDDFTVVLGVNSDAIDGYVADEKETDVKLKPDTTELDAEIGKQRTINSTIHVESNEAAVWFASHKRQTVYVDIVKRNPHAEGLVGYQGTAHITGNAYAGGNWGLKHGEYALTGEMGPELVVLMPPYMVTCM